MSSERKASFSCPMGNGQSPLVLWVDWVPVSESNRRDHWAARHRRAKAAQEAFRLAVGALMPPADKDAVVPPPRAKAVDLSSGSSSSGSSGSTTTTSPVDSNLSGMPSPGGLGSMTATPGSGGSTTNTSGNLTGPS